MAKLKKADREYVTEQSLRAMGFRKKRAAKVLTFTRRDVSISKFHATPSWTMTIAGQLGVSPLTVQGVLFTDDIERGRQIQEQRIQDGSQ